MPSSASRSGEGFSLVDALVAASILAVAVASLTQLIASAATANAASGRATIATLLAVEKVEELRSTSSSPGGGSDSPRPGFAREWSLSSAPSDPADLTVIEVTVRATNVATRLVAVRLTGR